MALTIWAIFFLGTITERVLRDTGTDLWPCAANKNNFPIVGDFAAGYGLPQFLHPATGCHALPRNRRYRLNSSGFLYFAGRALLAKRDPRSALGWTAALVFMPVIGLLLYLLLA